MLRRVAVTVPIASLLTLYGFINYWQAIEAPDSRNRVLTVVLLLPIAALSTFFRAVSPNGHLSFLTYRIVLILGLIGQFFYYSAVLALLRWPLTKIMGQLRRHKNNVED